MFEEQIASSETAQNCRLSNRCTSSVTHMAWLPTFAGAREWPPGLFTHAETMPPICDESRNKEVQVNTRYLFPN